MISRIDVKVQAEHPNLVLPIFNSHKDAPSQVCIKGVPSKLGAWQISVVSISVDYPDNTSQSRNAVKVGDSWLATISEGSSLSGYVKNGWRVVAKGQDERGNFVDNFYIGVGDVKII